MNRNSFNRVFFFQLLFFIEILFYDRARKVASPFAVLFFLRSAVDFVLFLFFSSPRSETSFFFWRRRRFGRQLFSCLILFCFIFVSFRLGSSPLVSSGFGDDRSNGRQLFFFVYFYFILFFLGLTLFVVSNFAPPIHRRQKTKK